MKQTIIFCGYRDWALEIFNFIKDKYENDLDLILIKTEEEFKKNIETLNPSLIFFIGWSWLVEEEIVNKFKCICLHPSPLPKYRGGSPLQHQIINGEEESAVTLFAMDKHVDKGDIIWQEKFPLSGDLNVIFDRIIEKGKKAVSELIDMSIKKEPIKGKNQNEQDASYFKRRTPDQSEIKIEDLKNLTAKEIYNKIRALQDPYPNAFIICKNNTKLFLQKSKIEKEEK